MRPVQWLAWWSMACVFLTQDDIQAIAVYLREIKPVRSKSDEKARFNWGKPSGVEIGYRGTATISNAEVKSGAELYSGACAACHGSSGSGTQDGTYPSLFHNTVPGASAANNLVMVILDGVSRGDSDDPIFMPGFRARLSDDQVATLANFVVRSFGDKGATIKPEFVASLRSGRPPGLITSIAALGPALTLVGAALLALLLFAFAHRRRELPA